MKPDIHQKTQEWLLAGVQPAASDLAGIQEHLQSCAECGQLTRQVQLLEERLAPGMDAPEFSPSTLKQKSAAVRMEWNRRRMKTAGFTFLRYAGWTALSLVIFAAGWLAYSWLRTPGNQTAPASQPIQDLQPTATAAPSLTATSTPEPTPAATAPYPMVINPALCEDPSISPYMPGDDIAFDGGQVTVEDVTFEFWLTCANST